jgi:integrase
VPRAPRSKRVVDAVTGSFTVVGKAPNGQGEPYFDRSRGLWVAPWHKPDGKLGRPTGKTRVAAEASRDRHRAEADEAGRCAPLAEGCNTESTVAELSRWWLDNVARHRVRVTTWATYETQLKLVSDNIGAISVRKLRPEQVTAFVSKVIDAGSAARASNVRTLLVQVLDEAVSLGLAQENVAKKVRPPRVPRVQRRTLTPLEVGQLLAVCDERFVGAVAICYVQGWRISEALGLAWQDIDFDDGIARLRRGATYAEGIGMMLGPTKTPRTAGRQLLGPTVLELLRRRRQQQAIDEAGTPEWPTVVYDGEHIDLVFTTPVGKPMLRQHVDKAIRAAAKKAGLDPTGLGTHAGRRSVVTNLYASGTFDLADVARFVGHSDTATTRGYVQHEGDRPRQVSEKAFQLLDPAAQPR